MLFLFTITSAFPSVSQSDRGAEGGIHTAAQMEFSTTSTITSLTANMCFSRKMEVIGDHFEQSAYLMRGQFWVNNHAHVLKGKPLVLDNEFLVNALNFLDLSPFISGTTRGKLNQGVMSEIPFPLPPFAEQTSHRTRSKYNAEGKRGTETRTGSRARTQGRAYGMAVHTRYSRRGNKKTDIAAICRGRGM